MNKYINTANAKVIGNAGLRVGKDIIREGTKAVAFKTVSGVVVGLATEGVKGVKDITLDDILGDMTRKENKVQKNEEKVLKREFKLRRKHEKATMSAEDLEALDAKRDEVLDRYNRSIANLYATNESDEAVKKYNEIWNEMTDLNMTTGEKIDIKNNNEKKSKE